MSRASRGRVSLVGAGPGRADLLTLRGAALLSRADAVVLDALVDRAFLRHCRPGVRVVDAGKRGHGRVLMRQPAINRLLVRLARAGKNVVRLKGGDPCLFGRGGEEAAALAAARVPFEIVPGVSSVTAAPAHAGVPLTHRDFTSTVTIVTGHGQEPNPYLGETAGRAARPPVDWAALPRDGTLVVLMGLKNGAAIAASLLKAGWPPSTPALAVASGTLPEQKTARAPLADFGAVLRRARLTPPGLLVFGRVVGLGPRLDWFSRRPLFGKTVLVARPADQAGPLTALLEERGARVVECPAIRVQPLAPSAAQRAALRAFDFDGVLFTSVNAVRWARPHLPPAGIGRARAYAVGPKTADALRAAGVPVAGVASEYRAEGLARVLPKNLKGRKFLFPRAEAGRDVLIRFLEKAGARVTLWPVYRTVRLATPPAVRRGLAADRFDAAAFTSSSTVEAVLGGLAPAARRKIFETTRALSIGPLTSKTLRAHGAGRGLVEARGATVESMVEALEKAWE
jgi:uroporphyrinogen III methyltransferase/synthase